MHDGRAELLAPGAFGDAPLLVDDLGTVTHAACGRGAAPTSIVAVDASRGALEAIVAVWRAGRGAALVDAAAPPERRARLESIASALQPTSCAAALFTSGSSGDPKLAVHRATSLVAAAQAANARVPFGPGDRWLLSLSPHHVGGLAILVRSIVAGAATRIGRGPTHVGDDLLRDPSITHVSVVGTQLRRLLDDPRCVERLRSMKAVLLGGGPAPASWRHEAVRAGVPLYATYGMTECASQITTARASETDGADDAGTPLDGVELRLGGNDEILVRGPTVFAGYLEGAALRDPRDADGWFATGDLGAIDARGHLRVLGRRDAMFISGGENIHPEEIENALRSVPGITQACVIAIDDPRWQRRPVVFVTGAFDEPALLATLSAKLERFRWPDRIYAMPASEAAKAKPSRAALGDALRGAQAIWERHGPAR
ncbi:MAG: AMP-binding protein [Phycisphaerae bacterium]|nr:AMP-binding protein [Phycisphaerae bacterium]